MGVNEDILLFKTALTCNSGWGILVRRPPQVLGSSTLASYELDPVRAAKEDNGLTRVDNGRG